MACLQKKWSILEYIASIDANNPHLSNQEVIRLAAENKHASVTLRQDREFVLSLVSEIDRVLHHAPAVMKTDKDILAAAMVRSAGTISDCFISCFNLDKEFEFLSDFSSNLRVAILLRQGMADPLCRLSCLDQGTETVVAYRKLIGEFANIPLGTGVESLLAALANMEKFGF